MRTTISPTASAFGTRPLTRKVSNDGPVSTVPPGVLTFWLTMARCTSTAVSDAARSRSGSSTTWICRLRPPTIDTCPTPETFSSASRISWSAYSVTSRMGRVDCSARKSTGAASGSSLLISGLLVPSGRSFRIVETCSRTSCAATLTSLLSWKLTMTCETPSVETERSSSMPLMVLIASSILSESSVAISSGAAPGSVVMTCTTGRSTLGKRSTLSCL